MRTATALIAIAAALVSASQAQNLTGTRVPAVTAYTEDGRPFDLRAELVGHHSVIVFGCLT